MKTYEIPLGEDGEPDTDQSPNGWCDVCNAPISDNPTGGVRFCSEDITHDCYGDGFNNGGDPYEAMEGPVYPSSRDNSRGFSRGEYVQTYRGCGRWRLRESSNAEVPCLWLDLSEPPNLNDAVVAFVTGQEVTYQEDYTVQLSAADARLLRDALDEMLANHYHGDVSSPNPDLEDEETIN